LIALLLFLEFKFKFIPHTMISQVEIYGILIHSELPSPPPHSGTSI